MPMQGQVGHARLAAATPSATLVSRASIRQQHQPNDVGRVGAERLSIPNSCARWVTTNTITPYILIATSSKADNAKTRSTSGTIPGECPVSFFAQPVDNGRNYLTRRGPTARTFALRRLPTYWAT